MDLATEEFLQSLAVTTRNSDLPHLTIKSAFKSTRLREIFGRLKALQSDLDEGAETSVPTDDASKGTAGLEGAIRQLADAVSSLTEETKRLAARAERRSR
ncbi:hypothetical protein GOL37_08760 [Sinorhizobium medicae]|nr:hypothetical protein [Sinorhizobium medicae]MDX1019129.1 hypothetical protein [Sinorhizobium medicae]